MDRTEFQREMAVQTNGFEGLSDCWAQCPISPFSISLERISVGLFEVGDGTKFSLQPNVELAVTGVECLRIRHQLFVRPCHQRQMAVKIFITPGNLFHRSVLDR